MVSLLKRAKSRIKSRKTKRFKSKRNATKVSKLAKSKSRLKRFSSGRSNFVKRIPIIGNIVSNPRVQKGLVASGTVGLIAGLAQLIPNQGVQNIANNPLIKTGAAFAIGDIEGAIAQTVQNSGGLGMLLSKVQTQGLSGIFGSNGSMNESTVIMGGGL